VLVLIKDGEQFTAPEDGVYMPFWYYRKLFNFIVDTQTQNDAEK